MLGVLLLAGCTPQTPVPPAPADLDFTQRGVAAEMMAELMAAAGSTRVVDVEFTRTEARVSFVAGQDVTTYAYRDQQISQIDSDIAYVGQAIFDPRAFALDDIGTLFASAAVIAGSDQSQQLQIVDYDSGKIYMNVTTNPESMPVFFSTNAALVTPLDPANTTDLTSALPDVVGSANSVVRIGIGADGSVYADLPAGDDQIMHTVRLSRFPVRDQLKSDTAQLEPFDPSLVRPFTLNQILSQASIALDRPLSSGYDLVIEKQPGDAAPVASVTMSRKTVQLNLDGTLVTH